MIKSNLIKNRIPILILLFIILAGSFGSYSYYRSIKNNERIKIAEIQKRELELAENQRVKLLDEKKEKKQELLDATEEITFDDAQLKDYHAIYDDPYVIHIRKALNGYLDGTNEGMEMPESVIEKRDNEGSTSGLASFDKEYYKSKFVVFAIDNALGGGKEVVIIFQDKPDKFFTAWVYKLAGGQYDLRGLRENIKATENIEVTLKAYKKYIFDKEYSL